MLGIIFFSLVFGAALTMLPKRRPSDGARARRLGEAIVKIIDFAMRLAPYGVFGLIFVVTSRFGFALLLKLGLYVRRRPRGTLPARRHLDLCAGSCARRSFAACVLQPDPASIITAFSTSSSNATLPTNIAGRGKGVEDPAQDRWLSCSRSGRRCA